LTPSFQSEKDEEGSTREKLESLFDWMDEKRWNLSGLLTALSEGPSNGSADRRTPTHRRRIQEFLNLDSPAESTDSEGGESLENRLRRWKHERRIEQEKEKGADEIVRMWELQGGLGRNGKLKQREKGMEDAVKELHLNGDQSGPVAGVVSSPPSQLSYSMFTSSTSSQAIRSVINRYHEAYNESQADIAVSFLFSLPFAFLLSHAS
jgi:hypothetical protein